MKKIFLILFLFFSIQDAFSQKVNTDRILADGTHQIVTESEDYSVGWKYFYFCLRAMESRNSLRYELVVSSQSYIPENVEILLKLGNEEVIHLKALYVNRSDEVSVDIHDDWGFRNASIYDFPVEYLEKIVEYGIKKIRISDGIEFKDREFRRNGLGKYLTNCYKNIQECLNKPLNKDLYDDF